MDARYFYPGVIPDQLKDAFKEARAMEGLDAFAAAHAASKTRCSVCRLYAVRPELRREVLESQARKPKPWHVVASYLRKNDPGFTTQSEQVRNHHLNHEETR